MTDRRRAPAPAHGPAPVVTGNAQMPNILVEIARIAKVTGRSVDEVRDDWSERAAIREYLGGFPRYVSESRALADLGTLPRAR